MLFSVGYRGGLTPPRLLSLARALDAQVWDVRGSPRGRPPWGAGLPAALGAAYTWAGATLGNAGGHVVTQGGLAALAAVRRPVLLLCACEAPGDCHRHRLIAAPLLAWGVDVTHVYRDEIVSARELERAIVQGGGYYHHPLSSIVGLAAAAAFLGTA